MTDSLERSKLIELLQAVESVLADQPLLLQMDAETVQHFVTVRDLVQSWLRQEPTMSQDQRLQALSDFTAAMTEQNRMLAVLGAMPDNRLQH